MYHEHIVCKIQYIQDTLVSSGPNMLEYDTVYITQEKVWCVSILALQVTHCFA